MTTIDRRHEIVERLYEVLEAVSVTISTGTIPAGNIVRNRNELPASLVPGIIMLDADEVRDQRAYSAPAGRQLPPSFCMLRMTPEIYVVLDVRKPHNVDVGADLNAARVAILKAVLTDQRLQDLCGSNGQIYYDGCVTDLARNRTMKGQLGISITFVYPLLTPEL